jgi:hypothetical protein
MIDPKNAITCLQIIGIILTTDVMVGYLFKLDKVVRLIMRISIGGGIGFITSLLLYDFLQINFIHTPTTDLISMSILGVGSGVGGIYLPSIVKRFANAKRELARSEPEIQKKIGKRDNLLKGIQNDEKNFSDLKKKKEEETNQLKKLDAELPLKKRISTKQIYERDKLKEKIEDSEKALGRLSKRIRAKKREEEKSISEITDAINSYIRNGMIVKNIDNEGKIERFQKSILRARIYLFIYGVMISLFIFISKQTILYPFLYVGVIVYSLFIAVKVINIIIINILTFIDDGKEELPLFSIRSLLSMFILGIAGQILIPDPYGGVDLLIAALTYAIGGGIAGFLAGSVVKITNNIAKKDILLIGSILSISATIFANR